MCVPRPRLPYLILVSGILLTLASGLISVAQTTDPVEQRIQRIQRALVPPVLAKDTASGTSLTDRMAALHVPGVSIAVIHGGKIEWARGWGVTRTGGTPVTPDTLFQAASISKPVTAMAVLKLVQSGKLDLDADVNQYLKTWKLPDNEFTTKQKVTLRELLTHTAGVTVHGFPGYASDTAIPTLVQVLNGVPPANSPAIRVDTLPGKEWRYSGGGFVIAQLLVQDVTGQAFPVLMRDLVLKPVGMTHSTYEQPLPPNRVEQAAMPYRQSGQAVPGGPHIYPEMSPAGLWTTPSDLALFALEIQNALAGKSDKVLTTSTTRAMLQPGLNKWGLGIETGGSADHPYFTHSGANEGFQCNMVAYNNGDGAVIMTNSDSGGQLAAEILRTIAHEYQWPDFGPRVVNTGEISLSGDVLSRYAGVYEMSPGVNMTITIDHSQLISQMTRQGKVPLFAESENMFYPKVVDAKIEFPKGDGNGPASQLILHQNGRDMTGKRLSDVDAKKVLDAQTAVEKRFAEQKPAADSEAAAKRMIAELQAGKPDYDRMSPGLAAATRQQLPQLQPMLASLGLLQSITFKGVGPAGADIYELQFEKGKLEYRIGMADGGKVDAAGMRPLE